MNMSNYFEPVAKEARTNESFLVAAIGDVRGVLAQCFARDETQAKAAIEALAMDSMGGTFKVEVIDREAAPGLWLEGSAEYIKGVLRDRKVSDYIEQAPVGHDGSARGWPKAGISDETASRAFLRAKSPLSVAESTPSFIVTSGEDIVAQVFERPDQGLSEKDRMAEMWSRARLLALAPKMHAVLNLIANQSHGNERSAEEALEIIRSQAMQVLEQSRGLHVGERVAVETFGERKLSNFRDQEQPVAATESVFFAKLRDVSRGLDVIENALAVASGGDLSQVPFPMVREDAKIHLNAQKGAYLHVLEMCSADSLTKWLAQAQSGMPDEAALLSKLQEVAQGLEVIEGALKISSSGDLSQAPFPLVGQEAQIHLNAQSEAYLHALEMCNASTIQEFLNGNLDQDRDAVTSYRDRDSCPGM